MRTPPQAYVLHFSYRNRRTATHVTNFAMRGLVLDGPGPMGQRLARHVPRAVSDQRYHNPALTTFTLCYGPENVPKVESLAAKYTPYEFSPDSLVHFWSVDADLRASPEYQTASITPRMYPHPLAQDSRKPQVGMPEILATYRWLLSFIIPLFCTFHAIPLQSNRRAGRTGSDVSWHSASLRVADGCFPHRGGQGPQQSPQ